MTLFFPLSLSPSLLGREMPSTQKEEEDVGETFEDDGITSSEEVRAFVIVFALCFVFGKRSFFPIGLSLSLSFCLCCGAVLKRVRSSRDDWRPGDALILARAYLCAFIIYLYTHHRIVFLLLVFRSCVCKTEESAIWYETRDRRRRGRGERRRRCRERRRRQHDQCE